MKKKVLAAVVAVAIAAVAVINMDLVSSRKQEALSAIHLANIEALAQGESGETTTTCHTSIRQKDNNQVFYCATCGFVRNSEPSFWSSTSKCK